MASRATPFRWARDKGVVRYVCAYVVEVKTATIKSKTFRNFMLDWGFKIKYESNVRSGEKMVEEMQEKFKSAITPFSKKYKECY